MQHLRKVYINKAAQLFSPRQSTYLKESLEEISSFLWVSPDFAHVIHVFHKEFSLTAT
jgi:hypothetical protein